jgi:DNA-binding XRE family transcriptional regulator
MRISKNSHREQLHNQLAAPPTVEKLQPPAQLRVTTEKPINQQQREEHERAQKALGRRIRNLRQARHWPSKVAFARACGIDRNTLLQIEKGGANLELYTLLQIAKRLKITVSDLFYNVA